MSKNDSIKGTTDSTKLHIDTVVPTTGSDLECTSQELKLALLKWQDSHKDKTISSLATMPSKAGTVCIYVIYRDSTAPIKQHVDVYDVGNSNPLEFVTNTLNAVTAKVVCTCSVTGVNGVLSKLIVISE